MRARARTYAFGTFRLAADGTLLQRDGLPVPLTPKVLRTLLVLVERAGEVVTKDELLREVWPDSHVEETGLTRNVSLLRQALGDEAQQTIVTAARIGYRFAAPVETIEAPRRLLVLPFTLLVDDARTGFLAFSVPDAVANALSGLESLVVRSSAVAARFGGQPIDLARIAADANVDAIVTGTLARAGEQVRASVQLVAVPCGSVLWSDSLQVGWRDAFELQDQLVTHIVRSLSLSLTARERRRLRIEAPRSAQAYEFFLRGNEAIGPQGILSGANLRVARELYVQAIDADGEFAPAWARLGRCHYLIAKSQQLDATEPGESHLARAEACFQRALALDSGLALADSLYALLELDDGRARSAMTRLIGRALAGGASADLHASLVQACRYSGLLEPSVAAHYRARALDPAIATGGYQSLWHLGDEEGALREGVRPVLLAAVFTGMRGDAAAAIAMLRGIEAAGPTLLLRCLIGSIRAVFEGDRQAVYERARPLFETGRDPESWYFAGRALAYFGDPRALEQFARALDGGYVLYRALLRPDPWLDPLRSTPAFGDLVARARDAYRQSLAAYVAADGERLLGPAPSPETLEGVNPPSRSARRA